MTLAGEEGSGYVAESLSLCWKGAEAIQVAMVIAWVKNHCVIEEHVTCMHGDGN